MLDAIKKKILLFLGNPKLKDGYNPKEAKTFLIYPSACLGDSLVTTPSIRSLRKNYPDSKIYIMVCKRNERIFKNNPYIDGTVIYSTGSFIKLRNKIDVFVDTNIFIRMKTFILFRILNPKYFITGYKREVFGLTYKDFSIYKSYIPENPNQHTYKTFMDYFKLLDLSYDGKGYDLYVKEDTLKEADSFWKKDRFRILVNLYGTVHSLNLNNIENTLKEAIKIFNNNLDIVFLWEDKTLFNVKHFVNKNNLFRLSYQTNKEQMFALIRSADTIVTVDTGVVHIATAFNKPQLSFFKENAFTQWSPLGDNVEIVECKTEALPEGKVLFNFDEKYASEKLLKIINTIQNKK